MGEIVQFPARNIVYCEDQDAELDLFTAVDVAIRDLADIARHMSLADAREQAEECRRMLVRAFEQARI